MNKILHLISLLTINAFLLTPSLYSEPFKGWSHVANRLIRDGVSSNAVLAVFNSRAMPYRPFVPFGIGPKETRAMYSGFISNSKVRQGRIFLDSNRNAFSHAEREYLVSRYFIAAILLVETQFGLVTGKSRVVERLARGASVAEGWNIRKNYLRLLREGFRVSLADVEDRAYQVEKIFYPQLRALFEIGRRERLNILNIRGSVAGAFGLPQFMPIAYLQFGTDGNRDGRVSLFDPTDAIHSVGKYLSHYGWRNSLSYNAKLNILWHYNKSRPYGETILKLAELMR